MRFYKRVYDPAIGQWLTPDPLGFADGPNLYAYVHSNPLRFCDPYGLSMKEFFKGFAASAAQVGAACVAKWAVVGAVSFFCPPLGAAVSSAMTAYSVGMTAYSVGKCAYDNYDTLQEIGDAALAGDLGQIAAWGIDAVCSMSYEQLGSLAFDAVSIAAPMARVKGAKAVADAKAASVAASAEKAAKKKCGATQYNALSSKAGANLQRHLRYCEEYGMSNVKYLENGRIRYYGDLKLARTPGEMIGQRYVHEFNPDMGSSRGWFETLDVNLNIRQVRPQLYSNIKIHYMFDECGNLENIW
ncbi:RHS repeat-associated core domain-containing protein [Waddlia chondrophila]|uniref:Putative rhs family protein n=1 Tax=Waddlia chondrophila (strain ATCC VR-1470 / WSU 86-1044) TaxID=716544 RepID=D6YTU0_WADCW|nr:putative rhs family protein [Waddlia chondrophila WSU 86-1044]